jgi:hypothetical protein
MDRGGREGLHVSGKYGRFRSGLPARAVKPAEGQSSKPSPPEPWPELSPDPLPLEPLPLEPLPLEPPPLEPLSSEPPPPCESSPPPWSSTGGAWGVPEAG